MERFQRYRGSFQAIVFFLPRDFSRDFERDASFFFFSLSRTKAFLFSIEEVGLIKFVKDIYIFRYYFRGKFQEFGDDLN